MVATTFASGVLRAGARPHAPAIGTSRAVAVGLVAILLAMTIPYVPGAQAQIIPQTPADVSIQPGDAQFYQQSFDSGRTPTSFIANSSGVSLRVAVRNSGPNLTNVPVYFYLETTGGRNAFESAGSGNNAGVISGCKRVETLLGVNSTGATGVTNVIIDSIQTNFLPPGPYNVTVVVLPTDKPTQAPECSVPSGQTLARRAPCTPSASGNNCVLDTNVENNFVNAFLVKSQNDDHQYINLKISEFRWCELDYVGNASTCDTDMIFDAGSIRPGTPYNAAPNNTAPWAPADYEPDSHTTFFQVTILNEGTYGNMTDWGRCRDPTTATCKNGQHGFLFELNVTVKGNGLPAAGKHFSINETTENRTLVGEERPTTFANSRYFGLENMAGVYNVTIELKNKPRTHPLDNTADVWKQNVTVFHREFVANFTASDFKTTAANPYPQTGGFLLGGRFNIANLGPISTAYPPQRMINYSIYLNNMTSVPTSGTGYDHPTAEIFECELFRCNGTIFLDAAGEEGAKRTIWFNRTVSDNPELANYLSPGSHTLYITVDPWNEYPELNETNNTFSIPIFIRDTTTPLINNTPKIVKQVTGASINSPNATHVKPLEAFNVYVNATDDDDNLNVTVKFTLDSNSSINRTYQAVRSTNYHVAQISTFNFHNFTNVSMPNGTESWTMLVTVRDGSNNTANATPVKLQIEPWPLHTRNASEILLVPTLPQVNMSYSSQDDPFWKIRVRPNWTGYNGLNSTTNPPAQQNYTQNMQVNITSAKYKTFVLGPQYWTALSPSACPVNSTPTTPGAPVNLIPGQVCNEEENNTFVSANFDKEQDGAGPGLWNYSIIVRDIAGHARTINGTYLIEDLRPVVNDFSIPNRTIQPGEILRVDANFSDDANEVVGAYIQLNRTNPADNLVVNLTMVNGSQPPSTGGTFFVFNESIETGRGKRLGVGGTFNVTLAVSDGAGNWGHAEVGTINITDNEAPQLMGFGVIPPIAEVGENVTFWANVSDLTNVSVKLEIFRGTTVGELLRDAIIINQSSTGNFTATVNFSKEAIHAWTLTPIDSVNKVGNVAQGTITIRDNLGPKYEVRAPSVKLNDTLYASGTPRIEVVVFDVEGVVRSSIDMRVAGQPVQFTTEPAPGNLNGWLVVHEVPANRKFAHNSVVNVTLSAKDNSTEQLLANHSFAFTVDATPPTARLVSVSPSYRDQPAHIQNVSLKSLFTLAADDTDGLPTGVASIRYRVFSNTNPSGGETVYGGPFRLESLSNVRAGLYTVSFTAEDAVGNVGNANLTQVFVDDTPPALFQFLPQNRFINATWVDDRVGVKKSVIWYRANDQPYLPLDLAERDGVWHIALPEGQKGDRISYYLQAWDRLDNEATVGGPSSPHGAYNVSNHEPKIRIITPVDGGRIVRSFDLTWEASDEDSTDALVFTIHVKRPGQQTFTELDRIASTSARSKRMDVSSYADGEYTFRVTVSDGGFAKSAETTVTIINRADPIGAVKITGSAVPGETMLVTAEVTKSEALVEARLYRDGTLENSFPMNDEGRDGDLEAKDQTFSVLVPIEAAGDYRVEIYTTYKEDGVEKTETLKNAATFSAKLTPGYVLRNYGTLIAIIGLLAVVGIGVAVFVVMRRR